MTDSRIDAGPEPAGDDARRPARGRSGAGRARSGGRAGFGEGGRGRGSRRRDTAPGAGPDGPDGAEPPEEMADPEAVARGICLRALTGAAKTRQQLAELLQRKDVPPEAADAVLDRFTEVGLIDDAAFAAAWVSSRQTGRGLARRALAAELRAKGVDGDVAAAAVAEVDPQAEWDSARQLVARRAPGMRRLDRVTAERRLVGMLARKGYGGGLAGIVVREALDELFADGGPEAGTPGEDEIGTATTSAGAADDTAHGTAHGTADDAADDASDETADDVPAGGSRSNGFGRRGTGRGLGGGAPAGGTSSSAGSGRGSGTGGFGSSRGFGSSSGFGGRTPSRRAKEGKPNGSALGGGGAGGIAGQRAASMADEVGEGHWEPITRRTDPPGRRR